MKRLIWSAFVAFWSSVGTIVAVGALSPTPVAAIGSEPQLTREVSLDELAQHNTEADCWIAIRGKVYDFSTYIPEHPAPPVVLVQWCGKEATAAYATKGYHLAKGAAKGGRPHSAMADAMLARYLIGIQI